MTDLPDRPRQPTRKRVSKDRLLATVAVSTLAAIVFFSLFYVIGAVVGLALFAAVGVAMVVGLAWMSLKLRRKPAPRPVRARDDVPPPTPLP